MSENLIDNSSTSSAANDVRQTARTSLLIRPVKLIADEGEFLCVIRDVSESGMSLRSFHPLPELQNAQVEMQTGERIAAKLVWRRDREAGFQFSSTVDVKALVNELGKYPKRPLRFDFEIPIVLCRAGERVRSQVADISQQGAKVHSPAIIAIGEQVRIESDYFPDLIAKVCWRRGETYGLVFENRFSMHEFADMAARMQCPELVQLAAS